MVGRLCSVLTQHSFFWDENAVMPTTNAHFNSTFWVTWVCAPLSERIINEPQRNKGCVDSPSFFTSQPIFLNGRVQSRVHMQAKRSSWEVDVFIFPVGCCFELPVFVSWLCFHFLVSAIPHLSFKWIPCFESWTSPKDTLSWDRTKTEVLVLEHPY